MFETELTEVELDDAISTLNTWIDLNNKDGDWVNKILRGLQHLNIFKKDELVVRIKKGE